MAQETELKKLHENFLEELRSKGRSNSTIIAYGKDIEQLIDFLNSRGVKDASKVSYDDLDAFKKSLEQEKYTNKSISRKINSIRTFYRFLIDKKVIADNAASKLEHPKFETAPPRILSEIEYRALRDSCRNDQRLYSIVEILLQTGIRIGELTRLEMSDVKLDEPSFKTMKVKPFGSHPERVVPLNAPAVEAIENYLKIRPNTDSSALFVTKNGNPLLVRNIRTSIDRAFKKAGVKNAKVNDLRNTFIAHHLSRGTSLVTVSKLVGHKRISTTEKYLGLLEGDAGKQVQLEEL